MKRMIKITEDEFYGKSARAKYDESPFQFDLDIVANNNEREKIKVSFEPSKSFNL